MAEIASKKSKKISGDTPVKHKKKRTAEVVEAEPGIAIFAPEKKRKKSADGEKKKSKKKVVPVEPSPAVSEDTSTVSDDTTLGEEAAAVDPNALSNFNLSAAVKAQLSAKGIHTLFPIQAQTLDHCLAGLDLVGRARTGCGKTLAFVLPIVEQLAKDPKPKLQGRGPRVIVLAPTRELAKQVHADFEYIGAACGLKTLCLYGGSQYGPQEFVLRKGCDVVVGTPGRVKDHLERTTLKLTSLKFRVLDECDEMLNMGFVDDVEKILSAGGSADVQTLLFSATLPSWVKDITKRFLRPTHKTIDLVGNEKMKASESVKHLILPCHYSQRAAVSTDVIRCYAAMGRAIVFTDTKREADELAGALSELLGARPLHGDIPQHQREVTLAGFRKAQFQVLVATDVAARGLDISGVELVLQTSIPKDHETYIHRSGRTGRAASTGTSVMLVDKRKEGLVPMIERRAGVKFERIGSPQPRDMARVAGERAVEALQDLDASVVEPFLDAADALLAASPDARSVLARAIAKLSGHTAMQARSLLTAHEDFTTMLFDNGSAIERPGFVFGYLKRHIAEDKVEEVKRMSMCQDGKRAVFDLPSKLVEEFLNACKTDATSPASSSLARGTSKHGPQLTVASELPELKASFQASSGGPTGSTYGSFGGGGYGGAEVGVGALAGVAAEGLWWQGR